MTETVQPARKPKITRGRLRTPERILCYGIEGVGKSTFAAGAPRPIFIDVDKSTGKLDVDRIGDLQDPEDPPPRDFPELIGAIRWLHDPEYRRDRLTLVLDTADAIERDYIWPEVVRRWKPEKQGQVRPEKIGDIGFFKGYVTALEVWSELLRELDWLQINTRMNVIINAHATTKKVDNLAGEDFSSYEPDLYGGKNTSAAELLREWAETVLFAAFEDGARREAGDQKEGGRKKTGKGFTTGNRVIWSVHQGWCMAKNRASLPETFPLSYEEYEKHVNEFYSGVWTDRETDPVILLRMVESCSLTVRAWKETPDDWYDKTFRPFLEKAEGSPEALRKLLEQLNKKITAREEARRASDGTTKET